MVAGGMAFPARPPLDYRNGASDRCIPLDFHLGKTTALQKQRAPRALPNWPFTAAGQTHGPLSDREGNLERLKTGGKNV